MVVAQASRLRSGRPAPVPNRGETPRVAGGTPPPRAQRGGEPLGGAGGPPPPLRPPPPRSAPGSKTPASSSAGPHQVPRFHSPPRSRAETTPNTPTIAGTDR